MLSLSPSAAAGPGISTVAGKRSPAVRRQRDANMRGPRGVRLGGNLRPARRRATRPSPPRGGLIEKRVTVVWADRALGPDNGGLPMASTKMIDIRRGMVLNMN